jgi:thiamine pyrophosphate-dependent acetolactate synthase large subunit-like protein
MMTHREALEVLAAHHAGKVVVSTMGSVAIWPKLSDTPLDFAYNPSSMGQGIALGLGLALAKPGMGVVVLMGDGSLLMNLGSLVTVAQHPADLYVLLIDNGLYEVTGGQPVAGAGRTDFAGLARAAGIARVYACATVDEWRAAAPEVLDGPGPVFVWLRVRGELGQQTPAPPRPMAQQVARLRGALGSST